MNLNNTDGVQACVNPLSDTQAELDAITREMDVIYGQWPSKDDRPKREELLTPLRARCVEIGQRRYRIAAGVLACVPPKACRWFNGRCIDCGRAYGEPRARGVALGVPAQPLTYEQKEAMHAVVSKEGRYTSGLLEAMWQAAHGVPGGANRG
jgi:hypothetical protein